MLTEKSKRYLDNLTERYPSLLSVRGEIERAYLLLENCYKAGGKLLIAGNGGSAADAEHIAGELLKSFCLPRRLSLEKKDRLTAVSVSRGETLYKHLEGGLAAIPLSSLIGFSTAYSNDAKEGAELVYAQAVTALGKPGDLLLAISTSGDSENIVNAAVAARAFGLSVIGLSGASGGELFSFSDVCIRVPEKETYKVQELHLPIYHCLCLMLEEHFFGERDE